MGILAGKVVVVTGAARERNIGESIAVACRDAGATVVVTSRSADAAREAASRLGARVEGAGLDLTSQVSVDAFARDVLRRHAVHGIVHNAGAPLTEWTRGFLDVEPDEYARVFDVDVVGGIRLTRALLPSMIERRAGALVFTSSTAAMGGYEHLHEFSPAKAGVLGLMRGLAAEFGKDGVRANAVSYGNIASPATWDALSREQREALAQEAPLRRWASPSEAAGAAVYLLSDLASFVTGQTLVVDGGTLMH